MSEPVTATGRKMVAIYGSVVLDDVLGIEAEARENGPCIFRGCVSRDRHWHGGFPGGYTNPDDPDGPPIEFTAEPAPGVRDYNGALLPTPHRDSGSLE